MDIKTTLANTQRSRRTKTSVFIFILIFILGCIIAIYAQTAKNSISNQSITLATVKKGTLTIHVNGYGRLKAKHQRLLTSQTQAIVEEIHHYPGAKVTKETIILTLANPALEQEVNNARLALAQQSAQLNELLLSHKSQLLERAANIALLKSDLEIAQLKVEAEASLIEKGIVSALDYKRSMLNVRQLTQRFDIENLRKTHLEDMQQQRKTIQEDLIHQFKLSYQASIEKVEQLKVKAGLNGILQTLPLEIGQSVPMGTQLAIIGSDQQLVVELKVQQRQADQINLLMPAVINISGRSVTAKVIRIDPIVTDGRVIIELDLIGLLPRNARPELMVEGQIKVKEIINALYVKQPVNTFEFTPKDIFKLNNTAELAQLSTIEFGTLSGNNIEIIKGAQAGEQIIISDMAQWQTFPTIELNN